MELKDKLKNNTLYPFHMPGHKRNKSFDIPSGEIDITEIEGFDNLHDPCGVLKSLEDDIKKLYHSKKSIISTNGSTACILSAISAVSALGDTIIIARNCHKSVYNACIINRLKIRYIEPEYDENFCTCTRITQKAVDRAVKMYPGACAVVITTPTYEGYISKISCKIPLILDAAHGSHFGFADFLPERQTADIVVNSLHKTLPSPTQTAVIHIYNADFADEVKRYMDIFETSSPSYILLAGVECCVDFLKNSKEAFENYRLLLTDFYEKAKIIKNIHFLQNDDPGRIVIIADGYTGKEFASHLRKCGIEPEGVFLEYVILISTVCDTKEGFRLLLDALSSLEKREKRKIKIKKPDIPRPVCEIFDIEKSEPTDIAKCAGKVCAEAVYAYPPGCPILAPGEIIDSASLDYISSLSKSGVNIISDSGLLPLKILTKRL